MSIYPDDDLLDDDAPYAAGCMRGVLHAIAIQLGAAVITVLLIIVALTVYAYLTTR